MTTARTIIVVSTLMLAACNSRQNDYVPFVQGIAYVGATVSDLDQTARFYSSPVDLDLVETTQVSGPSPLSQLAGAMDIDVSTAILRGVNAQLRLMQFNYPHETATAATGVQGPGIAHVCYQVNAETQAYQKFLAHGATPIGAIEMQKLNPDNPVEYAYAKDPDGLIFEIEHVDFELLDLETPPKHNYRIRHVSLATPDIGRLVNFYSEFLGDPDPRRLGRFWGFGNEKVSAVSGLPGSKLKMAWFQLRNLELEMVQYVSHPTEVPDAARPLVAMGYNMIVFDVSNLTIASAAFEAAGGEIVTEPGTMDGGKIVFGLDPDKNIIGLQEPAPGATVSAAHFDGNGS